MVRDYAVIFSDRSWPIEMLEHIPHAAASLSAGLHATTLGRAQLGRSVLCAQYSRSKENRSFAGGRGAPGVRSECLCLEVQFVSVANGRSERVQTMYMWFKHSLW